MTGREEIERLLYEYAALIDAGDFSGVGALFAHATYRAAVGGEMVTAAEGASGVADLLEAMVIRYEDGTPSTQHVVTNVVVDLDEKSGTATASSRFTVLQARPDFPLQTVAAGRYEDRFSRADGRWRFSDRLIHFTLAGDLRAHLRRDPLA